MSNPTWLEVARRPKWLLGLVFAILIAIVFALLGQWQLSRTFTSIDEPSPNSQLLKLTEIETPGEAISVAAANKKVTADIFLDTSNVYLVSNRLQGNNQQLGYWVICNSSVLFQGLSKPASLTVVIGFAGDLETAKAARKQFMESIQPQAFLPQTGLYIQSEAPVERPDSKLDYLLGSLSLAELVNLYSTEPVFSFAGILVLDQEPGLGLERVQIASPDTGVSVNWLTLFYALEWALFAGFAIFLWWRLVEDERVREQKISKR